MKKTALLSLASCFILASCSHKQAPLDPGQEQTTIHITQKGEVEEHLNTDFVDALAQNAKTNLVEKNVDSNQAAINYGAIMTTSEDEYKRPSGAHIQLQDKHEPSNHGFKRESKITVDPYEWRNFKLNNEWLNNRTHLIGWQFSGFNNLKSNLITATAYVNKGKNDKGTDENNPEGMLFYENRLDKWLKDNPKKKLDLYVKPVYDGKDHKWAKYIYMQWVGIDENGKLEPIDVGGLSKNHREYRFAMLENKAPGYIVDTLKGIVKSHQGG